MFEMKEEENKQYQESCRKVMREHTLDKMDPHRLAA